MDIDIHPVSAERLADFLQFFDHTAFVDNPHWASCYCYFYLADDRELNWESRTGAENRSAMSSLIAANQAHGYLAYVADQVVGWCHAGPRPYFTALRHDPALSQEDADRVGAIVCFNIAKDYRQRGVATQLLNAACAGFKQQGLRWAEAYPRVDAPSAAANYHGPLSMFQNAGFTVVQTLPNIAVVRKLL